MERIHYKIQLVIFFLFAGYGISAKTPDAGSGNLHNPSLVKKFYEATQRIPYWFNSPVDYSKAQKNFILLLDNAGYLGLDKSKYHYDELKKDLTTTDTTEIKIKDKVFTDAVISFCRDVYQGTETSRWLGNDEISGKYATTDDNYLLTALVTLKTASDISTIITSLEPTAAEYIVIKKELKIQLDSAHTQKVRQLSVSLNFYRWIHHFRFDKFIIVNIPAASLRYFEKDKSLLQMKVVVGKPATKTPRFSTYCFEVVLYPYWNVPRSIAIKELLPKFKRNPSAMVGMDIQVVNKAGKVVDYTSLNWASFSGSNFPYQFRQCTGCDNSLGVIKFNLTDPFSVYLHDTNFKKAFAKSSRFISHGCIRVEKPIELGNYLLNNKLDSNFVKACLRDQKPVPTKVTPQVPVFVVYTPATVDSSNNVVYLKDVYRLFK